MSTPLANIEPINPPTSGPTTGPIRAFPINAPIRDALHLPCLLKIPVVLFLSKLPLFVPRTVPPRPPSNIPGAPPIIKPKSEPTAPPLSFPPPVIISIIVPLAAFLRLGSFCSSFLCFKYSFISFLDLSLTFTSPVSGSYTNSFLTSQSFFVYSLPLFLFLPISLPPSIPPISIPGIPPNAKPVRPPINLPFLEEPPKNSSNLLGSLSGSFFFFSGNNDPIKTPGIGPSPSKVVSNAYFADLPTIPAPFLIEFLIESLPLLIVCIGCLAPSNMFLPVFLIPSKNLYRKGFDVSGPSPVNVIPTNAPRSGFPNIMLPRAIPINPPRPLPIFFKDNLSFNLVFISPKSMPSAFVFILPNALPSIVSSLPDDDFALSPMPFLINSILSLKCGSIRFATSFICLAKDGFFLSSSIIALSYISLSVKGATPSEMFSVSNTSIAFSSIIGSVNVFFKSLRNLFLFIRLFLEAALLSASNNKVLLVIGVIEARALAFVSSDDELIIFLPINS